MNLLNLFKRPFTNRAAGSGYRFLFGQSAAGKPVNEYTAMQMTAVYACVRVLSESIASLPLHVLRRSEKGNRERVEEHPLYFLLHAKESEIRLKLRQGDTPMVREVEDLRTALNEWKRLTAAKVNGTDGADCSVSTEAVDGFFIRVADGATIKTGESVTFHLKCGMNLTETLGRAV